VASSPPSLHAELAKHRASPKPQIHFLGLVPAHDAGRAQTRPRTQHTIRISIGSNHRIRPANPKTEVLVAPHLYARELDPAALRGEEQRNRSPRAAANGHQSPFLALEKRETSPGRIEPLGPAGDAADRLPLAHTEHDPVRRDAECVHPRHARVPGDARGQRVDVYVDQGDLSGEFEEPR
jgi:hypothetical protein